MDGMIVFACYAVILFLVSMVGAYLPQIRKLSDEQTHMLIALGAGIFLGLLFLMLIPEAFHMAVGHEGKSYNTVALMFLIGFLLLAFVDTLIKHYHMASCPCECHQDEHRHEIYSISAFIGLSVHACCDGLSLAAALIGGESIGFVALIGMCVHKFVVLFSLSSSLLLSIDSMKQRWKYLTAFSLITPLAGVVFYLFMQGIHIDDFVGLPLAFAAGTFMFVTFCNMIPEAFHRKNNELKSFIIVFLGVVIAAVSIAITSVLGGHVH